MVKFARNKKNTDVSKARANRGDNDTFCVDFENEHFRRYYAGLIPESEWNDFWTSLTRPLPTTFRITGSRSQAFELRDHIRHHFSAQLMDLPDAGTSEIHALPWYPSELAWELNVSKSDLRRLPKLQSFREYLMSETEAGNISRQEAVSMIPPLFLDIRSHHSVLDMCAAPGSKTCQLLEAMHADNSSALPAGMVIANDVDPKRSYLLVHQANRLQSPCLIVTNHDASQFPKIIGDDGKPALFDRILADVPCSGDGTIRKNPCIWKRWSTNQAIGLHRLQVQILRRACSLVKEGGIIVYSTCSMNPIENEAVLAAVLQEEDNMELCDMSEKLPELNRREGFSNWNVVDDNGNELSLSGTETLESSKIHASMFPPSPSVAEKLCLHRSMRVYPHFQNTGGFFIAVLRKKCTESAVECAVEKSTGLSSVSKEMPFLLVPKNNEIINSIREQFGIDDDFPDNFMVRSDSDQWKIIYFVSDRVKKILGSTKHGLKIVNTGIRCFGHCSMAKEEICAYRIYQDVLPLLANHLSGPRKVNISAEDLEFCLQNEYPKVDQLSLGLSETLGKIGMGGLVFILPNGKSGDIVVPVWRARVSINILLNKAERQNLSFRLSQMKSA